MKRRPPPAAERDDTPHPTPTGKWRTPGWSSPGRPAPEQDGRQRPAPPLGRLKWENVDRLRRGAGNS
ncbi:hypothetical protein GUJ93_ZPchr0006g40591 [Zizania palustris]|uniref:Uncharacterized protein n=1 Tax=Zizania palustris TaxID=103762 RepID=A0A8J5T5X7_ZIZPA|nr:hypothetical protein GUJ93_ZPchr0006g40591 [Zizania palustris]